MERLAKGRIIDEDRERLVEVERLANQQTEHSRILKALDLPETPQSAHRMLVKVGYWPPSTTPIRRALVPRPPIRTCRCRRCRTSSGWT
jgi:exoribonuclease-2